MEWDIDTDLLCQYLCLQQALLSYHAGSNINKYDLFKHKESQLMKKALVINVTVVPLQCINR